MILLLNLGGMKFLYQIALKGSGCSLVSQQTRHKLPGRHSGHTASRASAEPDFLLWARVWEDSGISPERRLQPASPRCEDCRPRRGPLHSRLSHRRHRENGQREELPWMGCHTGSNWRWHLRSLFFYLLWLSLFNKRPLQPCHKK